MVWPGREAASRSYNRWNAGIGLIMMIAGVVALVWWLALLGFVLIVYSVAWVRQLSRRL
jgi:uncharacterized membrane protein